MGKIRTVKPELFRHEELYEAEKHSQLPLRFIFIGLFTTVDREGRFRWKPKQLKLDIMPYDEIDFEKPLIALTEMGFICKYEYEDQLYGYIPTWRKHQSINKHEPPSRLPDPTLCKPMPTSPLHDINRVSPMSTLKPTFYNHSSIDMHMHATNAGVQNINVPMQAKEIFMQSDELTMQVSSLSIQSLPTNMSASLEMEEEEEKEKEMEVSGKEKNKLHRQMPDQVMQIFEYWKCVMKHSRAVLDTQRRDCIQNAIKMGYAVDELCLAIDGCHSTPHNMGNNSRGERFDGLHIIFKSADQIDRFIQNAQNPPQPLNKAEQRINNNLHVSQAWLEQHFQGDGIHD